ncbi:MAG: hypothetical protein K9M44_02385 [Candidatus Pacebacteria bacterium]|nr:hypothetical protein [Candidatus Paceibacterota bacterium]
MVQDINLQKFIDQTTIVKVYDNELQEYIFGEETLMSRFSIDQGKQVSLESLDKYWDKKSSNSLHFWTEEAQQYSLLQDSFRLFCSSFETMRYNKIACIQEAFKDRKKMLEFNNLSGLALYGMYYHGNKCIKIMEKLGLLEGNNNDFLRKFSGSRNKLIEHNYNPNGINLFISPSIWSLASTDSFLDIYINKQDQKETFVALEASIDYYEDYYKLESILAGVIKNF